MAQDPWANFPATANASPLPNGGVYVAPTLTPAQAADDARADRTEARAERAEARAVAADARTAEKDALAIDKAEREMAGGAAAAAIASEGERKNAAFLTRAIGANDAYNGLGIGPRSYVGEVVAGVAPGALNQLPASIGNSPERQQADAAQLEFISAILRSDSGAAIPEQEITRARQLYFPVPGDSEAVIAQKSEARERAIEGLRDAAGRMAPETPGDRPGPLDPSRNANAPPPMSSAAGPYMTPQDMALQDALRAAYNSGASLAELQAISNEYGRPVGLPSTQTELDRARQQGRQINVLPSGNREQDAEVLGITPDSAVGAYTMSAANALLSGGLDELGGALGADAGTIQAAKEAMRDRYPVSSFVGEVSGQVMQAVPAARALGAVGATGRAAQIGSEVAQGAAYGAGESNDNRLLGAGAGAGGALAGRAIAERIVTPAAQAIIQRISRDTGVPVEEVQRVAQEAMEVAEPPAANVVEEQVSDEVTNLARQAVSNGPRSGSAKRKLAEMAAVDPEAAAAAQRLGVDLPPDVLSENTQLRNLTGLARSQVGSEAEAGWQGTAGRAAARVQGVLEEIGATRDLAQLSENVGQRIRTTMDDLKSQANALRTEVDEVIDPKARVDATNLQRVLAETINDYGGLAEAKTAMSPAERSLLAMLGEGDEAIQPTYARLNRIRDDIGDALDRGRGPWADVNQRKLGEYYAALKQDRLDFVRQVGGDELADKMAASNALYSQMYDARREMVDLFGKNLEGGIVPRLRQALTTGSKGDVKALNQMLARIPEDMQGEVLLSGIMAESMSKTGANGGFSFANFAKLYRGLQQNAPIYSRIARAVGPQGEQILTDLYAVGRRIADAESRVLRTGKANQAQLATLNADNFVSSFLQQWGTRAAASGTGAVVGGPAGAAAASVLAEQIARRGAGATTRADRLHRLLSSPQFREAVEKVAAGDTSPSTLNRLVNSNAFVNFARATGLTTPEGRRAWLERAMTGTGTVGATASANAATTPEAAPRIELAP